MKNASYALKQIKNVIDELEERKRKMHDIVDSKINVIIEEKLETNKIAKTIEQFKKENKDFVESSRERIHNEYSQLISESKKKLEKLRKELRADK